MSLASDLRLALRHWRNNPGFALVAILALALGIGGNSAIFTVVDTVLLRALPFEDPGRLVAVYEDNSAIGFPRNTPAPANWVDWCKRNTVFTGIAASRGVWAALTGGAQPEMLIGRGVTANLWTILGARPALGRVFTQEEDDCGERVVVLSHGVWQRRFGGDPSVIGRDVWLSERKHRVVGVMPAAFFYPSRQVEFWIPASFTPRELARRGSHFLQTVARLKPGVTVERAQAEMSGIMKQLEAAYPDDNTGVGARVEPLRHQVVGDMRVGLWVLLAASGCVLLIACANIANLLLAKASGRRRETAVRAALGASRGRILRQSLTESLALAFAGAVAGLGVARLSLLLLQKLVPESMPAAHLALDWRALLFTIAVTTVTGILFGLAPGHLLSRVDLHDALKQGGRGGAGTRSGFFRDVLVGTEVALAVLLLIGAGLLLRTLVYLQSIDPGLRSDHLLTLSTPLPRPRYQEPVKRERFFLQVLDGVRALPGVTAAGYTSNLPTTAIGNTSGFKIEGRGEKDVRQDALLRTVSIGYLETLGARLAEGRFFDATERTNSEPVAIINETFARNYWPGRSPLGQRIKCPWGDDQPYRRIVGVVKEIRERGLEPGLKPAVYVPLEQARNVWAEPGDLIVRTATDPASVAGAVRTVVASIDPDQPIRRVRTMDEVLDEQVDTRRSQLNILVAFAGLALLLASLGLYGVLSFAVSLRNREIGIRLALGAARGAVVTDVLRRGLLAASIGLAIGAAAALALARLLGTLLHGVPPHDPWTFGLSAATLLTVAALACYLPARRAAAVDPAITLRDE